jgi:hypothetical protein
MGAVLLMRACFGGSEQVARPSLIDCAVKEERSVSDIGRTGTVAKRSIGTVAGGLARCSPVLGRTLGIQEI